MTTLDAGDRIGIALGWFLGFLVLPWFWMARGVLRAWEWFMLLTSIAAVRRTGTPYAILALLLLAAGASAYNVTGWYIVSGDGGELAVTFERGMVILSANLDRIGTLSAKEARELATMLNLAADQVDPPKPSMIPADSAWCKAIPQSSRCLQADPGFDTLLRDTLAEMWSHPGSTFRDEVLIRRLERMSASPETNDANRLLCSQFIKRLRTRIQERALDNLSGKENKK